MALPSSPVNHSEKVMAGFFDPLIEEHVIHRLISFLHFVKYIGKIQCCNFWSPSYLGFCRTHIFACMYWKLMDSMLYRGVNVLHVLTTCLP